MAHTFTCLFTHLIFSTKKRTPILTADIRPRLFEYMGGIIRGLGGTSILINGMEDHVHALAISPTTVTLADFLRDLKGESSRWAKDALNIPDLAWQTGYAAFSVSKSTVPTVQTYIKNQQEHHRRITFQEEYLKFLQRHEIDYDPRFVFD